MNKYTKIAIISAGVILFGVLLYYFGFKNSNKEYVTDSWIETYRPEDKGPYGTYILKELLDTTGLFGSFLNIDKKLEEQLEDNDAVNDIYFFIGKDNFMPDSSAEFLLDFVYKGNTAFMVCEYFPSAFLAEFCFDEELFVNEYGANDSMQTFLFNNSKLRNMQYKAKFIYNNMGAIKSWATIDTAYLSIYYDDGDTAIICGTNNENQVNFLKIKYGNGYVFIHSTPYLFTNISMMKTDGFKYVENTLKHIPPGRIQWDRYNLEYHQKNSDSNEGDGDEKRQSILQFLLSNPPLAWATILLLVGAFIYAVFKSKRMQKVVPATESKENTSVEYINTLSTLYLKENKHNKLVKLKEKTFLNFIADHYYILGKVDGNFIKRVSLKSGISEDHIRDIFRLFQTLENNPQVTNEQLILLHQKIEYFYKKCQ